MAMAKLKTKTKLVTLSAYSDLPADGVCAATGNDLAAAEATKLTVSIQVGGGNTLSWTLLFGPGSGPDAAWGSDILEYCRAEAAKLGA